MNNIVDQMDIAARLNDGAVFTNAPSHLFAGEDGRCVYCDCRPFGRWAPLPCEGR